MIHYKTVQEIEIMKKCGSILRRAVAELLPKAVPGITTEDLDKKAEELIIVQGAEPSFNKVKGYQWTICSCINEQVVHTPPSNRALKKGDLLTIDIGAYYKGMHTDYATTFVVGGSESKSLDSFCRVGSNTLEKAIGQAKAGNYLGQISQTIESEITKHGYYIMEQLTGHGIGRELHEDPFIPGFVDAPIETTLKIEPGLVIAIEVIYSMGTKKIAYESGNQWSIVSKDKSLSACFEHTIAITDKNTFILT